MLASLRSRDILQTFTIYDPRVHLIDTIFSMFEEIWEQAYEYHMLPVDLWDRYGVSKLRDILKESQFAKSYWEDCLSKAGFFKGGFCVEVDKTVASI